MGCAGSRHWSKGGRQRRGSQQDFGSLCRAACQAEMPMKEAGVKGKTRVKALVE